MVLDIFSQKVFLVENLKDFIIIFNKQREIWYNEIDIIIKNLKFEFDEIEFKDIMVFNL